MIEAVTRGTLLGLARLLTGVRPLWPESGPPKPPFVLYANHASHADFMLLWAVLPGVIRERTRPVAGADYWDRGPIRRFIGRRVVRAVLIDREAKHRDQDPIAIMAEQLDAGSGLILFPEGTRNLSAEPLLPFKSGLFHLAKSRPEVPLIPAWIDNLHRVLPKGEWIPLPLLCSVRFGEALHWTEDEGKAQFLGRASSALLALKPCVANGSVQS